MIDPGIADPHYDIIIVGSGLGALTTASVMAQVYDKRVLVLERHYVVGGFTHEFKRPDKSAGSPRGAKYSWDVGVHYIGFMAEEDRPRKLFDFVTNSQVKWNRMPDPFEKFHYPGFDFEMHGEPKRFRDDLVERFPTEEANIDGMFNDVARVRRWSFVKIGASLLPQPAKWIAEAWTKVGESFALQTTGEYLKKRFDDPKLRGLIASQWGTYALAPKDSSFLIHALVFHHFLRGGYYPEGGSSGIAKSVVPMVEAKGGAVLLNHSVQEIVVEDGRVTGVKVVARERGAEIEKRFYAPKVVSNVGAYNTYAKLLPPALGAKTAKALEPHLAPMTIATVYLGLSSSVESLGFRGENHWFFDDFDHDHNADTSVVLDGKPRTCYASFPSSKSKGSTSHTAELLGVVDYEDFKQWGQTNWKKRGEDYEAVKGTIAEGLIDMVNRRFPGFADLVDHVEVSTPLTVEHFTDHAKGAIYGLASTPARFREVPLGANTKIPGLYLTGADACTVGIVPVLLSGFMTCGAMMGPLGTLRLVRDMRARRLAMAASRPTPTAVAARVSGGSVDGP